MNIDVVYQPTESRQAVFLHAWDQNGQICHVPGVPSEDGTFQFTITGTTQDQRDVSFKYQFGASDWESDDYRRTVPTLSATKLWTFDYTARCLAAEPGTGASFPTVTIHAISKQRFFDRDLYVWVPGINFSPTVVKRSASQNSATTIFEVRLDDPLRDGFHFKLGVKNNQGKLDDHEPEPSNRVWRPSDGPEVWIKSGQVDVRKQEITLSFVSIDFIYPPSLGAGRLRIRDLVDDFKDTIDRDQAAGLTAINQHFVRTSYNVSVYPAAIYKIYWDTEPIEMERSFLIPLDGSGGPSMAVNGYDHWLKKWPTAFGGRVKVIIHKNDGSAFGETIQIDSGIGGANAHQNEIATRLLNEKTWTATFDTFPDVPCWFALAGESRFDGPLNFHRQFQTTVEDELTLHTVDGVGGVSRNAPRPFHDVTLATRRDLMESVYGQEIVSACFFEKWEMPHGTSTLGDKVYFTVRAPHAMAMSLLLLDTSGSTPQRLPEVEMELTNDLRYWYCAIASDKVPHGTYYRFAYQDGRELLTPTMGETLDPASRWVYDSGSLVVKAGKGLEESWSRVCDPERLRAPFTNSSWKTPPWEWLLIYEMHVRRFTQRNRLRRPTCDFDQVAAELNGGYLSRLPVSALEFLPVHEFPGDQGWGYNPSLFFAIDSDYGGPEPFARLVRTCHDSGRAVLLDIVFNHMVESPLQVLACSVYISGKTVWGDMVHYAHPAAIEYFRQALVYLWSTFHVDGFRMDSTETIINGGDHTATSTPYILASGPDGELRFGEGRGWEFLGILRDAIRRSADAVHQRWPYFVGENIPENTSLTDPQSGVQDGQWHVSEKDALSNAASNAAPDGYDTSEGIRKSLEEIDRPLWRAVPYAGSHDSESGRPGEDRIAKRAKGSGRQMAKAVGAVALLSKGIPMLLMGDEAAEDRPFPLDMLATDPGFVLRLDDYEDEDGGYFRVLTWFRDLMGLRQNPNNGLWWDSNDWQGFGNRYKTVAFSRAGGRFFVIATFGTPDTRQNLGWLNLPTQREYKEIFNSTWGQYRLHAEQSVSNEGYSARLRSVDDINLPSIGAVVLERW